MTDKEKLAIRIFNLQQQAIVEIVMDVLNKSDKGNATLKKEDVVRIEDYLSTLWVDLPLEVRNDAIKSADNILKGLVNYG